jgi:hypothetical protein
MDMEREHLKQSERHVAEAERIVAEQRGRIQEMRAGGLDVTVAKELLAGFERTLEAHRKNRDFIRKQIAAEKGDRAS